MSGSRIPVARRPLLYCSRLERHTSGNRSGSASESAPEICSNNKSTSAHPIEHNSANQDDNTGSARAGAPSGNGHSVATVTSEQQMTLYSVVSGSEHMENGRHTRRNSRIAFGTRAPSIGVPLVISATNTEEANPPPGSEPLQAQAQTSTLDVQPTTRQHHHVREPARSYPQSTVSSETTNGTVRYGTMNVSHTLNPRGGSTSGLLLTSRHALRFWESGNTNDIPTASEMFSSWHTRSNRSAILPTYNEATSAPEVSTTGTHHRIQYVIGSLGALIGTILGFLKGTFNAETDLRLSQASLFCFMTFYALFAIPYYFRIKSGFAVPCCILAMASCSILTLMWAEDAAKLGKL